MVGSWNRRRTNGCNLELQHYLGRHMAVLRHISMHAQQISQHHKHCKPEPHSTCDS